MSHFSTVLQFLQDNEELHKGHVEILLLDDFAWVKRNGHLYILNEKSWGLLTMEFEKYDFEEMKKQIPLASKVGLAKELVGLETK